MKATGTINIMLGMNDTNYSNQVMKRAKDIRTEGQPARKLDIKVSQSLSECHGKLSKRAHLMLMDFQDSQIETELEKQQIRDFCMKHNIINVQSEDELMIAIGMINKGIWDYIRP